MSLGEVTKCDLSAGQAKLDFITLTRQIENHFYSIVNQLNEKTNEIKADSLTEKNRKESLLSMISNGSNAIMRLSTQISETAELLHTLYESKDREIEIVNK